MVLKERHRGNLWLEVFLPMLPILLACCKFLFVSPTLAHGDIHHQIEALNKNIKLNGPSITVLIQRANLHRLHKNYR